MRALYVYIYIYIFLHVYICIYIYIYVPFKGLYRAPHSLLTKSKQLGKLGRHAKAWGSEGTS